MFIVLVRHGEIGNNKEPNKPLNYNERNYLSKTGIKQAKKTARFLKQLNIKRIYSSPYGRAYQTALYFSKESKKAIEILDWLREFQMGDPELTEEDWIKEIRENSNRYLEETYSNPPGWESTYSFADRIRTGMQELLKTHKIYRRFGGFISRNMAEYGIVLFAHGGTIKEIIKFFLDIPPTPHPAFIVQNGAAAIIEFEEIKGILYPYLRIDPPYYPDYPGWSMKFGIFR